jgi:uncharacterized membrane protein YedE/YeeE
MSPSAGRALAALVAGGMFGTGLVLGGMTNPRKVLGFLDIFGRWDASLVFVMLGAIAVHAGAYRLLRGWPAPLYAERFALPTRRDVDMKLLSGAAIFGIGWGLVGYCPGPALTSLAGGGLAASLFVAAMSAGMLLTARLEARAARGGTPRPTDASPRSRA